MRIPHVIGLVAGIAIALATISARHSGPAAREEPPPPPPRPIVDEAVPTHIGITSDRHFISVNRDDGEWRWYLTSPFTRNCAPGERWMDTVPTEAWGRFDARGRFVVDVPFTRTTTMDGRPAVARVRVRLVARRGSDGWMRGTFERSDVIRATGVRPFTCVHSTRFDLPPRPTR